MGLIAFGNSRQGFEKDKMIYDYDRFPLEQ